MNNKPMNIIKNICYVFVVHLSFMLNMILNIEGVTKDTTWFLAQILLVLIFEPTYFFVKGTQSRPWQYLLITVLSDLIFGIIFYFGIGAIYDGWVIAGIYVTEIILQVFFIAVALIDASFILIQTRFAAFRR